MPFGKKEEIKVTVVKKIKTQGERYSAVGRKDNKQSEGEVVPHRQCQGFRAQVSQRGLRRLKMSSGKEGKRSRKEPGCFLRVVTKLPNCLCICTCDDLNERHPP